MRVGVIRGSRVATGRIGATLGFGGHPGGGTRGCCGGRSRNSSRTKKKTGLRKTRSRTSGFRSFDIRDKLSCFYKVVLHLLDGRTVSGTSSVANRGVPALKRHTVSKPTKGHVTQKGRRGLVSFSFAKVESQFSASSRLRSFFVITLFGPFSSKSSAARRASTLASCYGQGGRGGGRVRVCLLVGEGEARGKKKGCFSKKNWRESGRC